MEQEQRCEDCSGQAGYHSACFGCRFLYGNQENKDLGTPHDDTPHGHGGRRQSVTERQK